MNLNIGIDIGAANARMVVKGRGLALDQSSACAMKKGNALAIGDEAYGYWGREYASLEVVFPLTAGVISREDALEAWLKYILGQASSMGLARISKVLIAKPVMMEKTQAQRYAAMVMRAGAVYCAMIPSDILAAIGAGIDVRKPRGCFVMNIGASQMHASAIARLKTVANGWLNLGMNSANDIISRMIRDKYLMSIGPAASEAVKRSLATASDAGLTTTERCEGFDLSRGFPGTATVDTSDVREAIYPIVEKARQLAMTVMSECSSQVQSDILEDGAFLTGGGASLSGMADILKNAVNARFIVDANPSITVCKGLEKVLDNPDDYEICMEAQQTLFDKRTPGK